MASPIRWFRKHAQFFIVVFGVVLMAIFGLGSVMSTLNPADLAQRTKVENPVVAKWSGGEFKASDLYRKRNEHYASLRFLNNVQKFAIEQNGQFRVYADRIQPIGNNNPNATDDELDSDLVDRMMLAERAKREGFVVSEDMVYQYIAAFGGETELSREMLKQLNRQVNNSVHLTGVVRHLQMELLCQQMQKLALGGLAMNTLQPNPQLPNQWNAVNPTEAIELYSRSKKKIEGRVMPVSVEEYVNQVEEPGESELKKIFEDGKYALKNIRYEKPGFKQPKRADIQYFVVDKETFVTNEMAKVTDEEVQAEYERLVEAQDNLVMQVIPKETAPSNEPGADGTETPANQDDDPAPAPATEDTPTQEESESVDVGEESSDQGQDESSSSNGGYTSVSFQEEDAENPQSDPSEQSPPVEDSQPAQETEAPSAEPSSASNSTDAEQSESDNDETDAPSDPQPTDPVMEDDTPKKQPRPLKDVALAIKRRLKTEDGVKARDEVVDAIEKELRKFHMKYNRWEFDKERGEDEDLVEPNAPDFQVIADKYGVEYLTTGMVDRDQIIDKRIGKVKRYEFFNQRPIEIDVGQQIFDEFDKTALYQPTMVDDFSAKYIYWLSEKSEQKVPTFEEARESVLEYWKRTKAIELALQKAREMAETYSSSGQKLAEKEPEKSRDTGAFPWFSTFGRFEYGRPIGVKTAGNDFMEMAFGLNVNEAGAALNVERDTAYIFQRVESAEDTDLAQVGTEYIEKKFFTATEMPREVVSAKVDTQQQMIREWFKEFNDQMDVELIGR